MDALEAHLAQKVKARRTRNALVRAKSKAYRNAKVLYPYPEGKDSWGDVECYRTLYVKYHYRNRRRCSCVLCGNSRRYWKKKDALTFQERRSLLEFHEEASELTA